MILHKLYTDIIIFQGTRSSYVENYLKTEKSHKHLIFVLNKCDLVPSWVTKGWIIQLSSEYPTLAFHASITKSFGKGLYIDVYMHYAVRPLLSAVLGRTKFWFQKPRIIEFRG